MLLLHVLLFVSGLRAPCTPREPHVCMHLLVVFWAEHPTDLIHQVHHRHMVTQQPTSRSGVPHPCPLWDGCWGPGAGLTGGKCWGQQPCPRKGTWRLAKSKAIPSLSCGGEDGLSVVCVSFGTGVEGESRWLSVALQASVRAKTRTRFLKSQAPSSVS